MNEPQRVYHLAQLRDQLAAASSSSPAGRSRLSVSATCASVGASSLCCDPLLIVHPTTCAPIDIIIDKAHTGRYLQCTDSTAIVTKPTREPEACCSHDSGSVSTPQLRSMASMITMPIMDWI